MDKDIMGIKFNLFLIGLGTAAVAYPLMYFINRELNEQVRREKEQATIQLTEEPEEMALNQTQEIYEPEDALHINPPPEEIQPELEEPEEPEKHEEPEESKEPQEPEEPEDPEEPEEHEEPEEPENPEEPEEPEEPVEPVESEEPEEELEEPEEVEEEEPIQEDEEPEWDPSEYDDHNENKNN